MTFYLIVIIASSVFLGISIQSYANVEIREELTQTQLEYSYAMEMLDGFMSNRGEIEDQLDVIKEIKQLEVHT